MQSIDDEQLFFLVKLDRLISSVLVDGHGEPLLEVIAAVEDLGQEEVEKSPEFSQVVLKRGSGKEQSMITLILLPQNVGKLAFSIFHFMSLIDHNILPVVLTEFKSVLQDEVIGRDADIPLARLHHPQSFSAGVGVSLIDHFTNSRSPLLKLGHPIGNCRKGGYDEERSKIFLVLDKVAKQSDCLNGFTQTHLVSKDTVQIIVVERH